MGQYKHASHGFTLTELMITLAIAGILAMLGAPAMGHLLARTQTSGTEVAIVNSLHHARSAAVMRNTRVVVCPSHDGLRCHVDDDWQRGWIVAEDADHDGQPDPSSQILDRFAALPSGARIVTSAGRREIAFHPNGNAAGSNVRFTICHANVAGGQAVVIANSGRVRLAAAEPARLRACLAGIR